MQVLIGDWWGQLRPKRRLWNQVGKLKNIVIGDHPCSPARKASRAYVRYPSIPYLGWFYWQEPTVALVAICVISKAGEKLINYYILDRERPASSYHRLPDTPT